VGTWMTFVAACCFSNSSGGGVTNAFFAYLVLEVTATVEPFGQRDRIISQERDREGANEEEKEPARPKWPDEIEDEEDERKTQLRRERRAATRADELREAKESLLKKAFNPKKDYLKMLAAEGAPAKDERKKGKKRRRPGLQGGNRGAGPPGKKQRTH